MSDIKWLADYLADASKHFLLSGAMGFLGCFLTLTILSALRWAVERGTRIKASMAVGYIILFTAILAGLACALLAHVWLDGYAIWYHTPLGPPLQIDTGGADL